MTSKSPVEKLTQAVLGLEQGLLDLHNEAQGYANALVRHGDALARQLANDIEIVLKSLVDEIKKELENQKAAVRSSYEEKTKSELEKIHKQGKENLDTAVDAVVEEIIKIVSGV